MGSYDIDVVGGFVSQCTFAGEITVEAEIAIDFRQLTPLHKGE